MPYKSRWQIDIPTTSLESYLFKSPHAKLDDKPILIDADKPENYLTFHTYREWSKRLAAGLRKNGFQEGDRLLLYSGNTIFFPVVMHGAIMAGGIFTGANPSYVARELAYQLKDSGAKFLITAEGSLDTALEAIRSIGFPSNHMFVMGDGNEVFDGRAKPVRDVAHWTSLVAPEAEGAKFEWKECTTPEQANETVVINYSSGTTGLAKGVEITHLNYIANCLQTEYLQRLDPQHDQLMKQARSLSYLPLYHAYGQSHHGVTSVRKGMPVYMMRKFDFIKMLQYIEKYGITNLPLVPPIAVLLAKRPEVKDYDLSSVGSASVGAAPLSAESINEFERAFKNKYQLKQGWGMTEVTCSAMGWDPNTKADPYKVGELNPNVEAMVVDDDGKELGDDQRGELWIRAPNVMKRYWRKPEATNDTITKDGWLKTGDVVIHHSDGYWSVVDRKKELIKVKGNQVAPAELEGLLLEHPAVQDAAVVGVTISGEEVPRAYVALRKGKSVAPENIAKWLAERVTRHKRVVGGVVLVDEIPKNPSGKILRKLMRDRAKAEVGDKDAKESRL